MEDLKNADNNKDRMIGIIIHLYIYRVSQKKWGLVFWAHFSGVKWPQIKKWKIRHPH